MLQTLRDWQELAGAILGGIFALATAFIVAGAARRREQRTAGVLLLTDLLEILAAAQQLERIRNEQDVQPKQYPAWLAHKLSWRRARLAPTFNDNMARLVDIDARLSAHLNLLRISDAGLQEHLTRFEQAYKKTQGIDREQWRPELIPEIRANARSVADSFARAAAHAPCAQHFIEHLVLSRAPFFKRVRMWIWPNEIEKESKRLLETGTPRTQWDAEL